MTAYSSVRFRPKPGHEKEFEHVFRKLPRDFDGLRKMALVKAPDGTYFSIGEWDTFEHMVNARPLMVGNLDKFRHTLQEHSEGAGVTDAVSGEAVFEMSR